jgi:hypothetical protein
MAVWRLGVAHWSIMIGPQTRVAVLVGPCRCIERFKTQKSKMSDFNASRTNGRKRHTNYDYISRQAHP